MVEPDRSPRILLGTGAGGLGSLLVAAGLVGLRGEIANVNVALVLVLVVLCASLVGGRAAGAMSSLVAAVSFDFFHTRPYGSLKIAGGNDLTTTLLLLVVGLVMGELAERSGRFKAGLREEKRHLRRLFRVAALAATGDQDDRDLVLAVSAELVDTLHLEDCRYEVPPFLSELPHLEHNGAISGSSVARAYGGVELPSGGLDLRVVGPSGTVGRFVLVPGAEPRVSTERLLVSVALAHELALALAAAS